MNYILIKADYSNGLPTYNGEWFLSEGDAEIRFSELVSLAKSEYKDGFIGSESEITGIKFSKTFFISDDRPTGNGYFYGIVSEDEAFTAIETLIDNSEDSSYFYHFGFGESDPDYKMIAPTIYFERLETFNSPTIEIDGEGTIADFEHCHLCALKRYAYDPSQPVEGDYVYNVEVFGWHNNEDEGFMYCDCIENIDWIVFYNIIGELFIH